MGSRNSDASPEVWSRASLNFTDYIADNQESEFEQPHEHLQERRERSDTLARYRSRVHDVRSVDLERVGPLFDVGFPKQDRHAEMDSYYQSFLLLTGFSFENLYRGMLTASGSNWQRALDTKGGHALFKHLSSVATLSDDEQYLVKRLETYLQWAGRYPVPKKPGEYVNAVEEFLRAFKTSDLAVANRLFSRLEEKLVADAAKSADRAEEALLWSLMPQKTQGDDATRN